MTTVSENFANSRAFKKAVADATKFSTDDFSFLRAYFESEKHNPSFEFKWLDKLSKGGLSRNHVLSIIYGGDSSPASTKRKPRASPGASPVASPRKQRRTPPPKGAKPDPQPEPEPETPKVARTSTRSFAMTPPTKNLRRSKKETRDEELSDDEDESESSESSDEEDECEK